LPRTFSPISTEISPSLNTPTEAIPMGMSRFRTIVRANSGLAFPLKTIKSFVATLPTIGFSRCKKYGWAGWIAKYILYFALRAVLRTSKIAPGDFVEPVFSSS
jgi:hypothetical protein